MSTDKKFKLSSTEMKEIAVGYGACLATDKITVNGERVVFMYRESPVNEVDSGWRFLSGTETQEYIDDPDNLAFYDINTIANYDSAIVQYLTLPVGVELERVAGKNVFNIVSQ